MGAGERRSRGGFHYGWVVVCMGMVASVGAHGFGRMAYTLVLPEMRTGLGITNFQAGLLGTGNFIGYLVFALIGGFLAARYGSRIVITLSLLLMGITMILTGMAHSFAHAFVLRLLTGIGNGGAYVPALALGSTWFAMRRRGFATGIVSGGTGAGMFISGLLVPVILVAYGGEGWTFVWYYLGVLVLIIGAICAVFLRNRPSDLGLEPVGAEKGSVPGSGGEGGRPGNLQWNLVYRVKAVWFLGMVYLLYGFSYVIYTTFFKAFLTDELGFTGARASALWALVGVLSIFCGMIWGGISDLLGRKRGAALAYFTLACAYLIFAYSNSLAVTYFSVFLFGLSAWSIPTIMAAAVGDYVGPQLAPAGIGFITLFFGIGQAFGPALGGFIGDVSGSFIPAFTVAALISLVGAAVALFLRSPAAESGAEAGV